MRSFLEDTLNQKLMNLENELQSDVIFFYGQIHDGIERPFRDFIEELHAENKYNNTLSIMLNTPGGSPETVERMVSTVRHHYTHVNFIVPDAAYSAGTIFCMSGDAIYMDYSSVLGPIDPQVNNGKQWVPALGYLDRIDSIISNHSPSIAEMNWLNSQDMAFITFCEQAKNLTIKLLEKWLVQYKFKKWTTHRSNNQPVTESEKSARAKEIAIQLGDNKKWHSHGRPISISDLEGLKLEITDYTENTSLRNLIREYNGLMCTYIDAGNFLHSRKHI